MIRRSKGSWSLILYLGRDPVTGKKRQKCVTFRGTQKAAERELNRRVREVDAGVYVESGRITVVEFLKKWLESIKANIGAKTHERYTGVVNGHLIPVLGALPRGKLQPFHIQEAYAKWQAAGFRKDQRKGVLSPQIVLHHHRILRTALHAAVKWQLLSRNPADALTPPRVPFKEFTVMDESHTAWLLDALGGTKLHVPVVLAVCAGMRRGEVLALKWSDVDLTLGNLVVRRSLSQTKAGIDFKEPKSRKGHRVISLPSMAVDILQAHLGIQNTRKVELGDAWRDLGLVCPGDGGSMWPPNRLSEEFAYLVRSRKLERIRFHDLRHSHASQLLRAGASPKVISERLGHSKVGFTLDTYAHLLPDVQDEAAAQIDARLRAALEQARQIQ